MAMEMKLNVNLKMSQKLVMTPMLQQAIKLLPLARLELAQQVRQEITENPVLEEIIEEDELQDETETDEEAKTAEPKENFEVFLALDERGRKFINEEKYKFTIMPASRLTLNFIK